MNKFFRIFFLFILIFPLLISCKDKKEHPLVDMDTIQTDGSHDDKYIFQKQIEKEEKREQKYKKNKF